MRLLLAAAFLMSAAAFSSLALAQDAASIWVLKARKIYPPPDPPAVG